MLRWAAILLAMLKVMMADGAIQASEVKTVARTYLGITGRELSSEDIEDEATRVLDNLGAVLAATRHVGREGLSTDPIGGRTIRQPHQGQRDGKERQVEIQLQCAGPGSQVFIGRDHALRPFPLAHRRRGCRTTAANVL